MHDVNVENHTLCINKNCPFINIMKKHFEEKSSIVMFWNAHSYFITFGSRTAKIITKMAYSLKTEESSNMYLVLEVFLANSKDRFFNDHVF